jgi:hypothetical protein
MSFGGFIMPSAIRRRSLSAVTVDIRITKEEFIPIPPMIVSTPAWTTVPTRTVPPTPNVTLPLPTVTAAPTIVPKTPPPRVTDESDFTLPPPIDPFTRKNEDHVLYVFPLNNGYLEFGLNVYCKLKKLGITNYIFLAMDPTVYDAFRKRGIPIYLHPNFVGLGGYEFKVQWGDSKFNNLVCNKVAPVLELLERGVTVLLSDVDIAWLEDPSPHINHIFDMQFTLGSCHLKVGEFTKVGLKFGDDGEIKVNTGFYVAHPTSYTVAVFKELRDRCLTLPHDDQTLMNDILSDTVPLDFGLQSGYYGFFDGCSFANGCVYFKDRCPNTTQQVIVHANFVIGKEAKLKKMMQDAKHDLWDETCVAALL